MPNMYQKGASENILKRNGKNPFIYKYSCDILVVITLIININM